MKKAKYSGNRPVFRVDEGPLALQDGVYILAHLPRQPVDYGSTNTASSICTLRLVELMNHMTHWRGYQRWKKSIAILLIGFCNKEASEGQPNMEGELVPHLYI